MKVVQAYGEKYSMVIKTNLTSICFVYKEKIAKDDLYKLRKLQYTTRFVK